MEWVQKSEKCEGKSGSGKIPKGCIDINNVAIERWQPRLNAERRRINCRYTKGALEGQEK